MNIKSISLQTYNNLIVTGNERKMCSLIFDFFSLTATTKILNSN